MRRSTQCLRLLYEIGFSIYGASQIVDMGLGSSSGVLEKMTMLLVWLYALFGARLPLSMYYIHNRHMFFDWWWFLAVAIFVCMRVLGRIAVMRAFLCQIAGVVAVAGPLFSWYPMTDPVTDMWYAGTVYIWWLRLETVVIVACVLLYFYRRWPTNAAVSAALLVAHFALWGLVAWNGDYWRRYSWQFMALLILPFCTALTWGLCVRLSAGKMGTA